MLHVVTFFIRYGTPVTMRGLPTRRRAVLRILPFGLELLATRRAERQLSVHLATLELPVLPPAIPGPLLLVLLFAVRFVTSLKFRSTGRTVEVRDGVLAHDTGIRRRRRDRVIVLKFRDRSR